nr:BrxA family protein [Gemmata massiliana]
MEAGAGRQGAVAAHATLAAAVKHSPLIGDFLDHVVREQHRLFAKTPSNRLWDEYLGQCCERDAEMPQWNESTRKRLQLSVFQTLAQAGYIDGTRTLGLQTVHLARPVVAYLEDYDEEYVLRCFRVTA